MAGRIVWAAGEVAAAALVSALVVRDRALAPGRCYQLGYEAGERDERKRRQAMTVVPLKRAASR